jgi:serine/threonine-protein kinase HipA
MARRRTRYPLNVYLNARLVGRLRRQASGAIDFQYDPEWLAWENALPVSLSLPLREDRYVGDPVIAVLDNLLPDSDVVRRRLAQRVHADGADGYSLLGKIGRDCVGALQFLPDGITLESAGTVKGRPIDDDYIARKIGDLNATPLGLDEDEEFRISLAGAQQKTAFLLWNDKWHVPHGTTATTHIMKPQIGMLPSGIDLSHSVENEYLCMKLAQAFGLPAANVAIAKFKDSRVLVVERFDRLWMKDARLLRLPQEDCCQALSVPPTRKYESDGGPGMPAVLDLLKASDDPDTDRRLFLKAQIMFWLLGATDGHAKNFSIFLQPGGRFRLTPLYDVMSVQPAFDAGQLRKNQLKFAMAVGDNRHYLIHEIMPRHFVQTAAKSGIPSSLVQTIFDELMESAGVVINRVVNVLPAGFPQELAESIVGSLRTRLRLADATSARTAR